MAAIRPASLPACLNNPAMAFASTRVVSTRTTIIALVLFAAVPGLPPFPFVFLGAACAAVAFRAGRRKAGTSDASGDETAADAAPEATPI